MTSDFFRYLSELKNYRLSPDTLQVVSNIETAHTISALEIVKLIDYCMLDNIPASQLLTFQSRLESLMALENTSYPKLIEKADWRSSKKFKTLTA